jgi:GTP-binding protein Era
MTSKTKKTASRAGYVVIIGAPNAGKSTLLNRLIGEKISITSPKPQTTRMRVTGITTDKDTQIIFIDTPGIFEPKRRLDRAMVNAAWQSLEDADVVVLLIDAGVRRSEKVDAIVEELRSRKVRVTLGLNKIDTVARDKLLPLAQSLNDTGIVDDVFMISAKSGDGLEDLRAHLSSKMPESPWYFDEEQISDLPQQILASEITREQLYRQLQQELPYAATVVPESWETKKDGSSVIRQTIVVSRKAHKPIVLGAKGARIKSIGEAARKDIAKFLGHPAHLFLEVKCDETWQDRPELYRMFGLEFKGTGKK